MDPITQQVVLASAGAGGAADPLYVDDVFSTFVYQGTSDPRTIENGIDLSGEGGLVWIKNRDESGWPHYLFDTERSPTNSSNMYYLRSDSTSSQGGTNSNSTRDFGGWASNGFLLGTPYSVGAKAFNGYDYNYVSFTFRKAKQFFDIVKYNGTGSVQNISHALGSLPGMIMIHCMDGSHDWEVYHRSTGATKSLHLNDYSAATTDSTVWNDTTPTSSVFTVGTSNNVNQNGHEYVAYIFAHDEQAYGTDSDEAIIKCGSYTGNGQVSGTAVTLGFEPQWVMIRAVDPNGGNWVMQNTMTGMSHNSSGNGESVGKGLNANNSNAESSFSANILPNSTGFTALNNSSYTNGNGVTYIYIAIRRPHKPPTAGTEVFAVDTFTGSIPNYISNFVVDFVINRDGISNAGNDQYVGTRLQGKQLMKANSSASEISATAFTYDFMNGWSSDSGSASSDKYSWMFKRASKFMDVVSFKGTGSAKTIQHNLNATPSVVLVKDRDSSYNWYWQHYALGANATLQLNNNEVQISHGQVFNSTLPTSSVFSVGSLAATNNSGDGYIAILFGDLDEISKAGTYSGTGYDINVDCGFTAGARLVIIKRADAAGDWYLWDTTRGIVSGNDPYLLINSSNAQVTNTDYIDPLNAGFTVTSSAPTALNTSGGTYIFLAIA